LPRTRHPRVVGGVGRAAVVLRRGALARGADAPLLGAIGVVALAGVEFDALVARSEHAGGRLAAPVAALAGVVAGDALRGAGAAQVERGLLDGARDAGRNGVGLHGGPRVDLHPRGRGHRGAAAREGAPDGRRRSDVYPRRAPGAARRPMQTSDASGRSSGAVVVRMPHRPPMPATLLSHQAPMVALKMARPRWFDGVAVVVGSMAPDFAYVATDTRLEFDAHGPPGMLAFAVPASVALAWLLRARVAAVFFTLAPPLGALRLTDWRVLAARRPPWRALPRAPSSAPSPTRSGTPSPTRSASARGCSPRSARRSSRSGRCRCRWRGRSSTSGTSSARWPPWRCSATSRWPGEEGVEAEQHGRHARVDEGVGHGADARVGRVAAVMGAGLTAFSLAVGGSAAYRVALDR